MPSGSNPLDEPSAWESMEGKVISTMQFNGEGGCLPDTNLTPLTKKFFDAFVAKYKEEPRGCGNVPTYTAMYLLKEAFEKAGSKDKNKSSSCARRDQHGHSWRSPDVRSRRSLGRIRD